MNTKLTSREWLAKFESKQGRPLRVLHMGNIANNAYINAKIMRQAGIEADVISPDYYHIMGCPEWEDADFEGDYGDINRPKWGKINLNGFKRPDWFLQGPRYLIHETLRAKNKNVRARELFFRHILIAYNFGYLSAIQSFLRLVPKSPGIAAGVIALILIILPLSLGQFLLRRLLSNGRVEKLTERLKSFSPAVYKFARSTYRTIKNIPRYARQKYFIKEEGLPDATFAAVNCLLEKHDISQAEVFTYTSACQQFAQVASSYDMVIAYATEGIFPLLAGVKNFASYEHGTIRDIPFEDSTQGRLCAATYQNSPAVFITNTDCVVAADRLKIPRSRQYWIPHAFDTDKIFSFHRVHREIITRDSEKYDFLAPARQHWKTGFPTWRKGNDQVIRAAKILSDEGIAVKIAFVEWGLEVDNSKQLISDLGVEQCFTWIKPMRKKQLWRSYMGSKGVIDQFVMPALGSVTFEAMALARPVISLLDEPVITEFFGEMPSIFNASTVEEIAAAMKSILSQPDQAESRGESSQDWIRDYHSSERILDIQISAIKTVISQSSKLTGNIHE